MVSTVPASKTAEKDYKAEDADDASESSEDSDPTELFHRDIGIQTSPLLSRQGSSSSLAESHQAASDPLTAQTQRVSSLMSQIQDLTQSRSTSGTKEKDISDQLNSFSSYLNELLYVSPYYSYKSTVPSWSNVANTPANDEFEKFRQEIRTMKGVMLSARNFPRGGA